MCVAWPRSYGRRPMRATIARFFPGFRRSPRRRFAGSFFVRGGSMLKRVSLSVFFSMLAVLASAQAAQAQTAQRWSIQLSALGAELKNVTNEDLKFGGGLEIQARFNPSALSIGFGLQTTRHQLPSTLLNRDVTVVYNGAFVEPRLILGSLGGFLGFYGSARFAILNANWTVGANESKLDGAAFAGGGGVLLRLSDRFNAEFGATAGKEY